MKIARFARLIFVSTLCVGLAACGGRGTSNDQLESDMNPDARRSTIWDLFDRSENPNNTVGVNKYLWNASLDVLNFLPIQTVDPFTGVIVTGYGTPPAVAGPIARRSGSAIRRWMRAASSCHCRAPAALRSSRGPYARSRMRS